MKLGLSLSGGGLKGAAHSETIKAVRKAGYKKTKVKMKEILKKLYF